MTARSQGKSMKVISAIISAALLAILSFSVIADQSVRGYTRRDGTYVAPHYRSSPNQYRFDNYGAQGNTNPYTGERGSQRHEFSDPPAYNKPSRQRNPYGR
jgi:hypothetical protein